LECAWFVKLAGKDPNSGKEIDEFGCAMAWLPVMLVENAMQSRQTGAAVESFRNEMVKQNETSHQLLERMNNPTLIDMIEVRQ
jgi:cyanate permease